MPLDSVKMLSFVTKTISTTKAPIRVRFKLPSSSITANNGQVKLELPNNQYDYTTTGATAVAWFRTYLNEFDFTQQEAYSTTITGSVSPTTGLTIAVTPSTTLVANQLYEVVIMTQIVGSTDVNFNLLSDDNTQLKATFYSAGSTIIATDSARLYKYNSAPIVSVNSFYSLSNFATGTNTLIFGLTTSAGLAVSSSSLLEIEFPSASGSLIIDGLTLTDNKRQIPCGVVGINKRTTSSLTSSAVAPRCILVRSSTPKIRIENYEVASATTFNVILYDVQNSVIAQDAVDSLDAVVIYTNVNINSRSKVKLSRAFTTVTGSNPTSSSEPLAAASTAKDYYAAATLTNTITPWPASCSPNCRLLVRSTGSDWVFQSASTDFVFQIGSTSQTLIVDKANNAFGKSLICNLFPNLF